MSLNLPKHPPNLPEITFYKLKAMKRTFTRHSFLSLQKCKNAPPPPKKKVEKEKMQAMLTQSVYVCLCVHMMDVEDIMSSHRANTE